MVVDTKAKRCRLHCSSRTLRRFDWVVRRVESFVVYVSSGRRFGVIHTEYVRSRSIVCYDKCNRPSRDARADRRNWKPSDCRVPTEVGQVDGSVQEVPREHGLSELVDLVHPVAFSTNRGPSRNRLESSIPRRCRQHRPGNSNGILSDFRSYIVDLRIFPSKCEGDGQRS
jgi:hypothetical protein